MADFGYDVGFSGQPKMWGELAQQNLNYNRKLKADSDKKDEEDWDKYASSVKVTGVHRLDQQDSNKDVSNTLAKINKYKQSDPRTWRNKVEEEVNSLAQRQSERLTRKSSLDKFTSEYDALKKSGAYTTKAQDALYEKVRSGTWDDVSRVQDEIGSVSFNPQDKSVSANWASQVNDRDMEKSYLSNNDYKTKLNVINGNVDLKGVGKVAVTTAGIPLSNKEAELISKEYGTNVPSVEGINDLLLSNRDYLHLKTVKQHDSGRLNNVGMPDGSVKSFSEMTPEEKVWAVRKNNYDDLVSQSGVSVKSEIIRPHKGAAKKKDDEPETVTPIQNREIGASMSIVNKSSGEQAAQDSEGSPMYKNKDGKMVAYKVGDTQMDASGKPKLDKYGNPVLVYPKSESLTYVAGKSYPMAKAVSIQYSPGREINLNNGAEKIRTGPVDYQISSVDKLKFIRNEKGKIVLLDKKNEGKKYKVPVEEGWFAMGLENSGTIGANETKKARALPLTKALYDLVNTKKKGGVNLQDFDESELFDAAISPKQAKQQSVPTSASPTTTAQPKAYDTATQNKINNFYNANKSRFKTIEDAIQSLIDNGRLPE